jgi:acetyl-CoA acetyltransferase
MPCAGAEAVLVCREETAKSLGLPVVRMLATIERHNSFGSDVIQHRGGWAMDIDELWAMAGMKPADVDFVETYDDYPVIVMMQFEDLGFCQKGEGPDFVRSHTFTNDGTFPHNTSGGQLSTGQAGAAGGFLGLTDAVRQLTDRPIGTAVPDARSAVISGFGMINYDRGLSSAAAVLARA